MYKNIVFDIGSVLVAFDYRKNLMMKYHNIDFVNEIVKNSLFDPIWAKIDLGIENEEEIIDELVNKHPKYKEQIMDFYESIPNMVYEYSYAKPLISKLQSLGYKVYLLSNFGRVHFEMLVEKMRFYKIVDGYVISYKNNMVKPNHEIYDSLVNKYNLKKEECLFIDDRIENVIGGINAGIDSIQFFSLEQLESKLKELRII